MRPPRNQQGWSSDVDPISFEAMSDASHRIYFDFVDPLSYVIQRLLALETEAPGGFAREWVAFELRPPPAPLVGSDDPGWRARLDGARGRTAELGVTLAPPTLVPWSRKAHELHLFAVSEGLGAAMRGAIFESFFDRGVDIGRVDALVQIAGEVGLDPTRAKAVLDVDRHEADVVAARREALAAGVTDVPCFEVAGRLVQGFPDPTDVGTFLPDA